MNVGFRILWRTQLNDQLNIRNIQSSSCNICSDQNLLTAFFELTHVLFSNILGNVSMKNYYLVLVEVLDKVIGFSFGFSEDYCAMIGIVFLYKFSDHTVSFFRTY
jgi:hypothetical protein